MEIHIKNLRLRTIIGINDWERKNKQDVVVNILIEFDGKCAAESDDINDTVNYKSITKEIIQKVENSNYFLLEKLADQVLQIVIASDAVHRASVQVEKPHALRFADSVSVRCSAERVVAKQ